MQLLNIWFIFMLHRIGEILKLNDNNQILNFVSIFLNCQCMPPFISTKYNNWLITYHITTASGDFMKALEILFYFHLLRCWNCFCYHKFKHYCWRSISLVYMLLTCKWRIAFMATKKYLLVLLFQHVKRRNDILMC